MSSPDVPSQPPRGANAESGLPAGNAASAGQDSSYLPWPGAAAEPPPPPAPEAIRPSRRRAGRVLIVAALVAGLAFTAARFTSPAPAPIPTEGPSVSRATPTTESQRRIIDNPFYLTALTGSCPAPTIPDDQEQLDREVTAMLGCLAASFRPLIVDSGFQFRNVDHRYYQQAAGSLCGRGVDALAFYCESSSMIHFSANTQRFSESGRLGAALVITHEYLHHVQSMIGIFDATETWEWTDDYRRRVELQTECWTMYTLRHLDGINLTSADERFLASLWARPGDPEGHGSAEAMRRWGLRGFNASDFSACTTWAAAADEVR